MEEKTILEQIGKLKAVLPDAQTEISETLIIDVWRALARIAHVLDEAIVQPLTRWITSWIPEYAVFLTSIGHTLMPHHHHRHRLKRKMVPPAQRGKQWYVRAMLRQRVMQ